LFDIGFQELVVIFIIALLVFGPKRLPELAKNMGKGMSYLKKAMFDIKGEIDREFSDTYKDIEKHVPKDMVEEIQRNQPQPKGITPEDKEDNKDESTTEKGGE